MAWAVLLILASFLTLPLPFLSIASRLLNHNGKFKRRFMLSFFSVHLLLCAAIFALSDLDSSSSSNYHGLISELDDLNLKVSRLETILEENTYILVSKTLDLDEYNKQIEELEHEIQFLQNSLNKMKTSAGSSSDSETVVAALEQEVRLLWAESRKNNFNYHMLESKANEEENKVKEVTSVIVKMENIITEQWIQIRQLEQSLQMMKIMKSNVHKKSTAKAQKERPILFSVLKFMKGVRYGYLSDGGGPDLVDAFFPGNYISKSFISRAIDHLKRMWSAIKKWHHELQGSVKWALEMNEFTAPLANKEVIFFLASVLVVMPIMSAWGLFCNLSESWTAD
ncbi:uncharacterized protein A4U43_C01F14500 [Asparagus officinalis]|uniref:Uncharacterized protein n=1 Tax=Asparagus officinalis TaxID=4686 RepID=A0A5P1FRU3_ASPOF|nr:uncharacterized protein LOC109823241 isoform X2 [Asparagus officinalis]ONK80157.1 uncharacterized protein A4U43_C01F14500 [Asparagus officinalis]